mmetsp:Transcript_28099/g.71372  ORF Transcript_28099/g.71372 Transcript_28099/m.71372 type:complete len:214 (+) Transcript_28099:493-1134(+)
MRAVHRLPPCDVSTLSCSSCSESTGSPRACCWNGAAPSSLPGSSGEGAALVHRQGLRAPPSIRRSHRRRVASTESTSSSSAPRLYPPPLKSRHPSAPRHVTDPRWPLSVCWQSWVRRSQSLIEWSRDPVNSMLGPCGAAWPRPRQWTEREWPMNSCLHTPCCTSHRRTEWSTEPERTSPDAVAPRHMTALRWPARHTGGVVIRPGSPTWWSIT